MCLAWEHYGNACGGHLAWHWDFRYRWMRAGKSPLPAGGTTLFYGQLWPRGDVRAGAGDAPGTPARGPGVALRNVTVAELLAEGGRLPPGSAPLAYLQGPVRVSDLSEAVLAEAAGRVVDAPGWQGLDPAMLMGCAREVAGAHYEEAHARRAAGGCIWCSDDWL